MLLDRGFKNVYPLKGGFYAWRDAGYPLERKSG
jgi:rhodanese-related sulfurtransferase